MFVTWIEPPRGDPWLSEEPDAVIWVSVTLIEADFAQGDQWVGPGGTANGQLGRYEGVGRLFRTAKPVIMAHLSIDRTGAMRFTDGRHGFAWVRDHGAQALPVTIDPANAAALMERFGTPLRICELTPV